MRGKNRNNYTQKEIIEIIKTYKANKGKKSPWLKDLAQRLNRPKENISRFARRLGLTDMHRVGNPKKGNKKIGTNICLYCGRPRAVNKYCNRYCADKGGAIERIGTKLWEKRPHPRGMSGKTHTKEYREKLSERTKQQWANPASKLNSKEHRQAISTRMSKAMTDRIRQNPSSIYSRTQKGWAEFDGGKRYYLRSGWELRYAKFLDTLVKAKKIQDWTYEEDTFWFEKIKRGVRSYTPDFKIKNLDGSIEYHEVKGWMDKKSATKLNRMRIYYPKVKLIVIGSEEMKNI